MTELAQRSDASNEPHYCHHPPSNRAGDKSSLSGERLLLTRQHVSESLVKGTKLLRPSERIGS